MYERMPIQTVDVDVFYVEMALSNGRRCLWAHSTIAERLYIHQQTGPKQHCHCLSMTFNPDAICPQKLWVWYLATV